MVENKCRKCGSLMVFDISAKALKCKSCGNSIDIKLNTTIDSHDIDFNKLNNPSSSYKTEIKTKDLKCNNCGARPSNVIKTIADKCEYCGASLFVEDDGGFTPDGCVLFDFDKDIAIAKFKEGIAKKKFLPTAFKKNLPLDNIEALYFPSFTFSTSAFSEYTGRLKIRKGDNDYYYRGISGSQRFDYNDVLLEGSRYLTQNEFSDVAPYDLGRLYKFDKAFINGFSVEYYNRTIEEAGRLAREIVERKIRRSIENMYDSRVGESVDRLETRNSYTNSKYSYLLLPVYKVSYKYGKKEYSTFVNGQTGKVGGRVPRSGKKIFALVAGIIAGAGLLIYAIIKSPITEYITSFFK